MTIEELQTIAVAAALKAELDPALVCAVCAHESEGWQQYAARFEEAFDERYVNPIPGISPTENKLRAMSFGLMQIMGETARELGFAAKNLAELFDPVSSVAYGCKKLKRCLDDQNQDVHNALLRYNGGSNPDYPNLVLAHYNEYAYLNSATRRP